MTPESGGPAESLRRLTECAAGYETEVLCLDAPSAPFLKGERVPVTAVGPGFSTYGYTPRIDEWLRENLQRFNGVVVHGLWQYHSYAVWRACRNKLPYLVFPHGMLDPWFKRAYPIKHLKKRLYWNLIERDVLRDAKAVLFTAELESELAGKGFAPAVWRSAIVPLGTIDPDDDRETQIRAFLTGCPGVAGKRFLLFLGRIHEKKGCDLLIQAFAQLPASEGAPHLVIAGPDQRGLQTKLETFATQAGIRGRVHFPGMLRGDAKWGALHAAEAFVLPSHQENFGIAVVEALACGTPVLISNKVNIWPEIAADGAGFVDDDTAEGTFRSLMRWESLNEAERELMGARGRSCFERRFDIRRASQALPELLEDCHFQGGESEVRRSIG